MLVDRRGRTRRAGDAGRTMTARAWDGSAEALLPLVRQLRLDHLAVTVSRTLTAARVPHALIKGPTTALWLYDPPREYRDVDLLLPLSGVDTAVRALVAASLAQPGHAALGEVAAHSLVLVAPGGAEIDVHVSLPGMRTPRGDGLWQALAPRVRPFALGGHEVPGLDPPGRALVIALHAVMSGGHDPQPLEDLRRAREALSGAEWAAVQELAVTLGVRAHVEAAVAVLEQRPVTGMPADVTLLVTGAGGSAIQLERLSHGPISVTARAIVRELFPTRAFVSRQFPDLAGKRAGYVRGWWRRVNRLCRNLPAALGQVRRARRNARIGVM